ncbi:MAG: hypothetical protein R2699_00260 [Acidimicrobiales bacterium]
MRTAESWLADGMPEPWVLYVPLIFPHPHSRWRSRGSPSTTGPTSPRPSPTTRPGALRGRHPQAYELDRLAPEDWAGLRRDGVAGRPPPRARIKRSIGPGPRTARRSCSSRITASTSATTAGRGGGRPRAGPGAQPADRAGTEGRGRVAVELLGRSLPWPSWPRSSSPPLQPQPVPLLCRRSPRPFAASEGGLGPGEETVDHADFPYDRKHALERDRPELAGRATAIRTPAWTYDRISDVDELYDRRRPRRAPQPGR